MARLGKLATPLAQRIKDSITVNDNGCWVWQKRISNTGYAQIGVGSRSDGTVRTALAHRVSYETFVGAIKAELQIDHLCKNRSCVNPAHLEQVTCTENIRRSNALWKQEAARTHCPYGHEYTEANTYTYQNRRSCKACCSIRTKARWVQKKAMLI